MTNYGIDLDDTSALDRAYTEEKFRRAKDLADSIWSESLNVNLSPTRLAAMAQELSEILHDLGLHLDGTAGFNITGDDQ